MDRQHSAVTAVVAGNDIQAPALRRLLGLLGFPLAEEAVLSALQAAGGPRFGGGTPALRQLDAALAQLGVRGLQLASTRGRAIEARHLPLLFEHDGATWVLVAQHGTTLVLESGRGGQVEIDRAAAADNLAIWLRAPREAASDEDRAQPARAMLMTALLQRKRLIAEVAVATFLTSFLTAATGLFSQQVYDRVVPSFALSTLWALVGILGVLLVFDFLLRVVRARMLDRVACDIDEEVSTEVFRVLGDVRLDARPRSIGTLAAQVGGLESARAFFTSSVLFTLAEIPFAIVFIVIIAAIGGPLAWVYVVAAVLALAVGLGTQFNVRRLAARQQASTHTRNGILVEAITGSETIKTLGAGWRFNERWRSVTRDISNFSRRQRSIGSIASSFAYSLSNVCYMSVVVFGVYEIEAGHLTIGGLTAITMLGSRVVGPISNGINLLTQAHSASLAMKSVNGVLRLPPERDADVQLLAPAHHDVDLALEGVRFGYGEAPVPQVDIDKLAFAAGDRVVLVGPPGSGKSTLLRLLAGLYRPSSGRVLMGKLDIGLLSPDHLRKVIGLLPQEVQLFRGSLRENLTLGAVVDDEHLIETVRLLGLDTLVGDHPRGLDRPIAEGGSGLSVGQRQLCGVARLIVRRPRVWLFDEPTSSLDPGTERRLYQTLEQLLSPEDILIVATHRPAAATLCSRALLMQRGRVVGDGDRTALLNRLRAAAQESLPK